MKQVNLELCNVLLVDSEIDWYNLPTTDASNLIKLLSFINDVRKSVWFDVDDINYTECWEFVGFVQTYNILLVVELNWDIHIYQTDTDYGDIELTKKEFIELLFKGSEDFNSELKQQYKNLSLASKLDIDNEARIEEYLITNKSNNENT